MTQTRVFDAARYLKNDEMIALFLKETLETGTTSDFIQALNTVARAKGMTDLAEKTGIGRESLYKTLSSEKPRLDTVFKIIHALGLNISITTNKTAVS
ncbi:addiction module antidote protein [Testudinibacter aquarius]|uniref:Addiction module antidote protein n=1 Tax=Testudinibacter aquarius TaxID=1524974 RepID=A0A4R3Y4H5_9PAST|nr:addiction module antidote protein [Testudinibacter aquarius]TNG95584.1 putative addiction module antidote protein [Pasteurellaceae bacterium USgator41]TNG96277.1 putative addiction module antidote protein [Pasteurellaceae bacterium UScroc12]TNG98847.1 putative addiction module antidote protein [Pasteurellaceae bacterium UScroc31]TNG99187.1 putative addiction module antidote protein [Pasteurellaceae bacterium USgator11]KAE9527991.1 addiction module antitoxin [Testudinibacter aquarius]